VLAKFFIDRPIFAAAISLLIALGGALSSMTLPISQYPSVTPPTIQVDCTYPGASSKVVSETIAAPIEQRVNGVERMLYMTSQSTSDGSYTCTIAFEPGTDLNVSQVLVQNRVNLALTELPESVRATGVTTRKRSPEILLTVSLNSPDGRFDQLYLSNYAVTRLKDDLSRIPGISDVTVFGQRDYSMRVWLDPNRLAARDLTALDVVAAIRGQNVQVSLGQIGPASADDPRANQIPLTIVGRLTTAEEFANVVVKATPEGKIVRIKDVGRVVLGSKSEDVSNRFDGKQTIGLAIFLLSDANALETSDQVKAKMAELGKDFPEGMHYEIGYDTSPFIRESIKEVFKTLRDSILLVAVVVMIFLQSWRAAIIPLAAVPVAVIGTFGAMWAVGFGLNNLTLFGLVLAVGIVVDDAIVVVEAVQHQLELGYEPREATLRAMKDVSSPIIAVGVVLAAVFLPCAFFSGIVGAFFRQFALTIAISTLISTFNSLTLSPALACLLLKPKRARQDLVTRAINFAFGWFFAAFDWSFDKLGIAYVRTVGGVIRVPLLVLGVYGVVLVLTYWGYLQLPTGFIPQQDKGYLIASVQLPDAASAGRTQVAMENLSNSAMEVEGVKHCNSVAGNSFVLSAYGSNFGSMFIILDDFEHRKDDPNLYSEVIAAKLRTKIAREVPEGQVNIFGAPAVPGLGRAGGFRLMVEDRGDYGPGFLQGQTRALIEASNLLPAFDANAKARKAAESVRMAKAAAFGGAAMAVDPTPPVPPNANLFSVFRNDSPNYRVVVDPDACSAEGIEVTDVYATMQSSLGSRYVNDFNRFGRTWQVNVQADQNFRNEKSDIGRLKVKSKSGKLVPIGAIAEVKDDKGPLVLTRYNMYPAAAVNGSVAPGTSSGDAMRVLEQVADQQLPDNMAAEWTELAFLENRSRDTGVTVFAFSVLVVFLVLAALYESWTLPLAVILVVPMCVSCSLVGVWAAKQDVNLFTQVGFVVLIGLACKNAILIVEYAKRQRDEGIDRRTAVLAACKLRLRPILMTSIAFVLGVMPLLFATGAGAEMRTALGTAVFAGMLGVTMFGIFLTPAFYIIVDRARAGTFFQDAAIQSVGTALRWTFALGFLWPILRKLLAKAPR